VFSGRPNPRWQLDANSVHTLQRLHARLSAGREPVEEPGGLGYRGFVYVLEAESLRAIRGHIIGGRTMLEDPQLSVERFLLGLVPSEFATLRDRIRRELNLAD
jgi:hypothetical protein